MTYHVTLVICFFMNQERNKKLNKRKEKEKSNQKIDKRKRKYKGLNIL